MNTLRLLMTLYFVGVAGLAFFGALLLVILETLGARKWRQGKL